VRQALSYKAAISFLCDTKDDFHTLILSLFNGNDKPA
jgi:hypothetical protein